MTWIQLALALLKFVNYILGRLHDKKMIAEGEQIQINKQLAEIARRSVLIKAAAEKVEKMTDDQVLEELKRTGNLRD